jgi:4-amino-4-deoxy-L-arabinose transferase-like glycosyltransferase
VATATRAATRLGAVVDALARLPLAAVVVGALVLRLAAGVAFPAADTETYEFGWLARNIADGEGYVYFHDDPEGRVHPEPGQPGELLQSAAMPPVYTGVTAVATWAADSHAGTVWGVRLLNLAAAAASVVLIEALARRLVGGRAARLAAIGFALYPALVYMSTQVSAANVYLPVELALFLSLIAASRSSSWPRWLAAGLVLGVLCLLRAEAVVLIPLAAAWLVWTVRGTPVGRARTSLVAVFAVAAIMLPGAWMVRNSLELGEPVPTVTTTGGLNLWHGNHAGASGSQKSVELPPEMAERISRIDAGDAFELRRDEVFRSEALSYMADDPVGTLVRDVKKVGLLLVADVHDPRSLNPAYLASYAVLATLGTAGLVRWWRDQPEADTLRWLVGGYLALSVLIPAVFFALARYRLPIEMMLVVFAAGWLADRTAPRPGAEAAPTSLSDMAEHTRPVTEVRG